MDWLRVVHRGTGKAAGDLIDMICTLYIHSTYDSKDDARFGFVLMIWPRSG